MATQLEVVIAARNMAGRAFQNATRDVQRIEKGVRDAGDEAERTQRRTRTAFRGMAMAAGPLAAAVGGAFAVSKIVDFGKAALGLI